MSARRLLSLLLLALLASPAAAAAADDQLPLRAKGDQEPLGNERLSNETTLTRWAHTNLLAPIRSKPTESSTTVGKLRWNTEDGVPEVYVVLQSRLDEDERVLARRSASPAARTARTGWVREEQLSNLKTIQTHLTIDRGKLRATLRKNGQDDLDARASASARPARSRRRALLDPRAALEPRRQPGLRALGVRHVGLLGTLTDWPGGGVDRDPRHEPARADPRPPLPRLRPRAERGDQEAGQADADRDPDPSSSSAAEPPQ